MIRLKSNGLVVAIIVGILGAGAVAILGVPDLWPWESGSQGGSEPAIVINDHVVSEKEFDQAYKRKLKRYRASLSKSNLAQFQQKLAGASGAHYELKLKSNLVDRLIRRHLLKQAAQEHNIQLAQSEIKRRLRKQIRSFMKRNNVSKARIDQALQNPETFKTDLAKDLRNQIRQDLRKQRLRSEVVGTVDPSKEQLKSFFKDNKLRYFQPKLVHVRHILVDVPRDAEPARVQSARQTIERIRAKWEDGKKFTKLAREYSDDPLTASKGGDYGWIQRGSPAGETFVETAFGLQEPGQVSEPIRTDRGFHLIQLVERRSGKGQTFQQVADKVREDYIKSQTESRFKAWFKNYRQKADIRIEMPLIAAYRKESKDLDAALTAYKQLRQSDQVQAPYLGYYIALIYEQKLQQARSKLEQSSGESASNQDEAEINEQIHTFEQKLVDNIKRVIEQGQQEQELYKMILKHQPDNIDVRYRFAQFLLDKGRWEQARDQLKQVLQRDAQHRGALANYGQLMLEMGEAADAVDYLKRALAANDQTTENASFSRQALRLDLAQAYRKAGNIEKAREPLKAILAEDSNHAEANQRLGKIALGQGDYEVAIDHLQKALKALGKNEEKRGRIQVMLGQAHVAAGNFDQGRSVLEKALESPSAVEAHRELGDLYRKRGETQSALKQYRQGLDQAIGWQKQKQLAQRIVELVPDSLDARRTLAALYRKRDQYALAIKQYRAITQTKPDSISAWRNLGDAYRQSERYDQAVDAYREALSLEPSTQERAGLWRRIFQVARSRSGSQGDDGLKGLTDLGLKALWRLANLAFETGDLQKSANYITKLIQADPSYRAEEVQNMASKLQDQGIKVNLP